MGQIDKEHHCGNVGRWMSKQEQWMASDLQDKMAMPMVSAALSLVWQVTHHMGDIQSREKDTQTVLAGVIEIPGTIFQTNCGSD